jgi:hypothetical protein
MEMTDSFSIVVRSMPSISYQYNGVPSILNNLKVHDLLGYYYSEGKVETNRISIQILEFSTRVQRWGR